MSPGKFNREDLTVTVPTPPILDAPILLEALRPDGVFVHLRAFMVQSGRGTNEQIAFPFDYLKRCTRCGRMAPQTEFHRKGTGIDAHCKGCVSRRKAACWTRKSRAQQRSRGSGGQAVTVESKIEGRLCKSAGDALAEILGCAIGDLRHEGKDGTTTDGT